MPNFPEEFKYDDELTVRGKTLYAPDYIIEFHNGAQAHAFAFMMVMSRSRHYLLGEPMGHNATATGFACEVPIEDIVGELGFYKEVKA